VRDTVNTTGNAVARARRAELVGWPRSDLIMASVSSRAAVVWARLARPTQISLLPRLFRSPSSRVRGTKRPSPCGGESNSLRCRQGRTPRGFCGGGVVSLRSGLTALLCQSLLVHPLALLCGGLAPPVVVERLLLLHGSLPAAGQMQQCVATGQ
jgi:hypothetical protein